MKTPNTPIADTTPRPAFASLTRLGAATMKTAMVTTMGALVMVGAATAAVDAPMVLIEKELPKSVTYESATCPQFNDAVEKAVGKSGDRAPEIVRAGVTVNKDCACELVQGAIEAVTPSNGQANAQLVGDIAGAAASAAPDMISSIGKCAEEAAPYARNEIRAAIAAVLEQALKQGDSQAVYADGKTMADGKEGKDVVGDTAVQPVQGEQPSTVSKSLVIRPNILDPIFWPNSLPGGVNNNPAPVQEVIKVVTKTETRSGGGGGGGGFFPPVTPFLR